MEPDNRKRAPPPSADHSRAIVTALTTAELFPAPTKPAVDVTGIAQVKKDYYAPSDTSHVRVFVNRLKTRSSSMMAPGWMNMAGAGGQMPRDERGWRVAPAPDGRGMPDPLLPRSPQRSRGFLYGTITTGAESDIGQATAITRQMVGRWRMSDAIGFVAVPACSDRRRPVQWPDRE